MTGKIFHRCLFIVCVIFFNQLCQINILECLLHFFENNIKKYRYLYDLSFLMNKTPLDQSIRFVYGFPKRMTIIEDRDFILLILLSISLVGFTFDWLTGTQFHIN